jgi:hypothetical protein
VATGLGSCSSYESKYRYRDSKRKCPECGQPTIIKGKEEYGGGWLCFAKRGGCGAKFPDLDEAITGQQIGRTDNEDIADFKNTVIKMAKKRAKVDAVLSATRSSGIFTQDVEDLNLQGQAEPPKPAPRAAAKAAQPRQAAPAHSPAPAAAPAARSTERHEAAIGDAISDGQAKRFWAIAKGAGHTEDSIRDILGRWGLEHSRDIPRANYDEICKEVGAK